MMITLEGISFKVVKRPLHQKKYLREIAWCGNEDTKNVRLMELHVIPNVCSEFPNKKFRPFQGLTGQ
jgi:hypothetical protein